MNHQPNADHCDKCNGYDESQIPGPRQGEWAVGPIFRLSTGGQGGINLCRACWGKEMEWRESRNHARDAKGRRMPNKDVAYPFKIVKFPGDA